jgi:hypothetical protein
MRIDKWSLATIIFNGEKEIYCEKPDLGWNHFSYAA